MCILIIYDLINYISLNFMHNVFNTKLPIDITNEFEYKINNYNIKGVSHQLERNY